MNNNDIIKKIALDADTRGMSYGKAVAAGLTTPTFRIPVGSQSANERKPKYTRIDNEVCMSAYQSGKNDREIASELGCTAPAVCQWRMKRGLKVNRKKRSVGK